jgi:hypothetical protein
MTRIYISDFGDDRNDGLTRETAIYSWQQAVKLCDGNTETKLMQGDATLQRLVEEIAKRRGERLTDATTNESDCTPHYEEATLQTSSRQPRIMRSILNWSFLGGTANRTGCLCGHGIARLHVGVR